MFAAGPQDRPVEFETVTKRQRKRRNYNSNKAAKSIHRGPTWKRRLKHRRPARGADGVGREPWDHKFWRMFAAQGGRCYLCPDEFTDEDWATEEHVVPRRRGGMRPSNVLLAHHQCNLDKGTRKPFPCELIFLEAMNARLPRGDRVGPGSEVWDHIPFAPLIRDGLARAKRR